MNQSMSDTKNSVLKVCSFMVSLGLTLGTWGNISAASPDRKSIIITPSGMNYDSLTPEDLITVDLEGQVLQGTKKPSIETPMHLAVYRKRPDVGAVVHTHSIYATAAAVARAPIPAVVEDMAQLIGGAAEVAAYALPGTDELAVNVVAALGEKNAVLLANHGVVGVGANIEDAFQACQVVEKTARIYAFARMFGDPVALTDEDIKAMHEFFKTKYKQGS